MPQPTTTLPEIKFLEAKYTHLYHDLRVFVCGVDVTELLRDRVSVSISDSKAPNTATIVLDNALDKLVFTEQNAAGTFSVDQWGRYSERPKYGIVIRKLGTDGKLTLRDRKRTIEATMKGALDELTSYLEENPSTPEDYRVSQIRGTVDKTVKKLNNEFFGEKSTKETRDAIMQEVIKRFDSLNLNEIRKQLNTSISQRKGALNNAADVETAQHTRPNREATSTNPEHELTKQLLHSFDPGDLVIEKNDPVVVYAHNPFTEADQWYPAFTGFVNIPIEHTDETTGESSVTLQCHCVRALMKSMRISLNAAVAQSEPDLVMQDVGYFSDIISANNTPFSTFIYGKSLEEVVCLLVTGEISTKTSDTTTTQPSEQDSQNVTQNKDNASRLQVGRFTLNQDVGIIRYPPSLAKSDQPSQQSFIPSTTGTNEDAIALEHWHAMTVLGTTKKFLTEAEVYEVGTNSYIGGTTDPWSRELLMLLPANGTNVSTLERTIVDNNRTQYNFTDRWTIIRDAAHHLDYQFYTTGNGDLVLEFPMYDFEPEDFGPTWSPLLKYHNHLIDSSVTPEAEVVPTGVIVTGRYKTQGAEDNPSVSRSRRVLVFSRTVAAKYGVTDVRREEVPFLTNIEQIKAYALIMYQRLIADASALSFSAAHRPFMMPNRPILHERRNRLGLSYAVEHTWEMGGNVSTEIAVRAIRKRVLEANGYVYRFVTGGTKMGISARVPLMSDATGAVNESGTEEKDVKVTDPSISGFDVLENDEADAVPKVSNADFSRLPENLDTSRIVMSDLTPRAQDTLTKMAGCVDTKVAATSGRRDEEKNREVGGAENSKHLTGDAFDISLRTGKPGTSKYDKLLSKEEKEKIINCALAEGYDVDEETQKSGPHLHCQPAPPNRTARYRKTFNDRADKANKLRQADD